MQFLQFDQLFSKNFVVECDIHFDIYVEIFLNLCERRVHIDNIEWKRLIDWDEYTSILKSLNRYILTHTSFNDVHEKALIINVYQFVFFERLKNSKLIINLLFVLSRQFKSFDLWRNLI
jgi:hypothetical protein